MVAAAADSIERDGIACTSRLEQTLFDDMNGLCRELMAELLSARAATARDYEPEPEERNAGGAAPLVCVMADGTGIPMRKECLKGAKGKDGRAKTREV